MFLEKISQGGGGKVGWGDRNRSVVDGRIDTSRLLLASAVVLQNERGWTKGGHMYRERTLSIVPEKREDLRHDGAEAELGRCRMCKGLRILPTKAMQSEFSNAERAPLSTPR